MSAKAFIEIIAGSGMPGTAIARGGGDPGAPVNTTTELTRLESLLAGIRMGTYKGVVRVRSDQSTGVLATLALTLTQASFTAGDYVSILPPSGLPIRFTAIVTGTPTYGANTFLAATSDTATATSLAAAVNASPQARSLGMSATSSTGTVTITITPGKDLQNSGNNAWAVSVRVASSTPFGTVPATFSGGIDPGKLISLTTALSGVIANNDTVTIGSVVLTGKSSGASGENQFVCNVSAAADGAALVACINAHSKLKGILLASGTATPSIQFRESGRMGALVSISKSCANMTLSSSSWVGTTTEAWATNMVEYAPGGAPA